MKEFQRVREFNLINADNEEEVNIFLEELGTRVIEVKAFYNTILGAVIYVVIYWM